MDLQSHFLWFLIYHLSLSRTDLARATGFSYRSAASMAVM